MKKWLLIATLFMQFKCFSLPVGNPKEAELFFNGLWLCPTQCCDLCDPCFNWLKAWSIRCGFYGDFVYNRSLKRDHHDLESRRRKLETSQIFTSAGYLALNFCNRADIFATLGSTNIHLRQNGQIFDSPLPVESKLEFSSHFSWSLGGRMSLWEVGRIAMGIEGQYFSTHPNISHFVNYNSGEIIDFKNEKGHYREWQVGLGISCHIATVWPQFSLVPYGAIKYSSAHLGLGETHFSTTIADLPEILTLHPVHSRRPWGCAIGVSFTINSMVGVTVETDIGDEGALYLNGQVRF